MLRPLLLLLLGVTLVMCNPAPGGLGGGHRPGRFPGGGGNIPGGPGGIRPPGGATCRYWCKTPENQAYCCEDEREVQSSPYVKPGNCPPVRPECPPTRFGGAPQTCSHDGKCSGSDKCCFDRCLGEHICKPVQVYF